LRTKTRRASLGLLLLALMQLAASSHALLVHGICPTHGELTHLQSPSDVRSPKSDHPAVRGLAEAQLDEHCELSAFLTSAAAVVERPAQHQLCVVYSAALPSTGEASESHSLTCLDLAPKCSPPTA